MKTPPLSMNRKPLTEGTKVYIDVTIAGVHGEHVAYVVYTTDCDIAFCKVPAGGSDYGLVPVAATRCYVVSN